MSTATISETLTLLGSLDTPVLEIVLDQARIAYRTQEAVKAAAQAAQQTQQQTEDE